MRFFPHNCIVCVNSVDVPKHKTSILILPVVLLELCLPNKGMCFSAAFLHHRWGKRSVIIDNCGKYNCAMYIYCLFNQKREHLSVELALSVSQFPSIPV